MVYFFIKRLLQMILVAIGVTIAVFLLLHFIPGDPVRIMAGEAASPEQLEQMRINLGLHLPLHEQFFNYFINLLQGDMGNSIRTGRPVVLEIFENRFLITLQLAIAGTSLSVLLGLVVGIISAATKNKYSFIEKLLMLISLFGLSIPNFWLGILLIQFFSVRLDLLPTIGWGTWQQMIMPTLTLGVTGMAVIARMTSNSLTEVLEQDYIRTAYAKGVKGRIIIFRHALKNALIPVVTIVGLQFGSLLGGAIITESIFAINGLGRLVIDAIRAQDFPLLQGAVLIYALVFVTVNFLVDISYRFINKRIELS